jgi:lipid II:glycine glycyltransferase (peptidoglycan interpeptide bridge formation enzyme)
VERDGELLAGILVYRYPTVWHTQYMAASPEGRKVGALDLVVDELIAEARAAGVEAVSFGTSTTDEGRELNEGLLWQKESFGGRSITHDFLHGRL